jgi:hypothetical protein
LKIAVGITVKNDKGIAETLDSIMHQSIMLDKSKISSTIDPI